MAHAEHTVVVNHPAEAVFDFIADGANNPRWRPAVVDIERASADAGAGATWRQGIRGPGGRRISGDYRITTWVRPTTLAFEVVSGPARPTGTYTFTPQGPSETRVTFSLDLQPRGLMRLMSGMLTRQVENEVRSLDNLEAALDS